MDTVTRHTKFTFQGEEFRVTDLELSCSPDDGTQVESLGLIEMYVDSNGGTHGDGGWFRVECKGDIERDIKRELCECYFWEEIEKELNENEATRDL